MVLERSKCVLFIADRYGYHVSKFMSSNQKYKTKQNKPLNIYIYCCSNKKCYNHPRSPLHTYFKWHSNKKSILAAAGIWAAETKKLSWLFSSKGKPKVFPRWKRFVTCVTCFNSSCYLHLQPLTAALVLTLCDLLRCASFLFWQCSIGASTLDSTEACIINYRAVKWIEGRACHLLAVRACTACARWRLSCAYGGCFSGPLRSSSHTCTWKQWTRSNIWPAEEHVDRDKMFIPLWAVSSLWMNLLHSF